MKKILIVDDEFLIRYSLSHMLESDSAEVVTAATGMDALREMADSNFALCCLDIHLPDMNGMEIMEQIKRLSPETRIIMMTGGEVTEDMLRSIQNNCELLLSKPFDLFKVKNFVDRILEPGSSDLRAVRNCEARDALINDQRRHERRPVAGRVRLKKMPPGQEQERSAEVIDVSENGMCLVTTYLMPQGIMLRICNDKTEQCTGTVRWSMRVGDRDLFRAGIEFA